MYARNIFFLHISSSYAKILGEKLFCTWEIPRSGSKAEDGGKKEKRKDWTMVKTMAKLRMAHASTHGARKPPGPKRKREREKDWTMMITMAKLRMAHASTHGARKPPGPIINCWIYCFKKQCEDTFYPNMAHTRHQSNFWTNTMVELAPLPLSLWQLNC